MCHQWWHTDSRVKTARAWCKSAGIRTAGKTTRRWADVEKGKRVSGVSGGGGLWKQRYLFDPNEIKLTAQRGIWPEKPRKSLLKKQEEEIRAAQCLLSPVRGFLPTWEDADGHSAGEQQLNRHYALLALPIIFPLIFFLQFLSFCIHYFSVLYFSSCDMTKYILERSFGLPALFCH